MVRRFRTSTEYPNKYPLTDANNQSSVPSQYNEVPPAFDPSLHPELIPTPPPQTPIMSIVRANFDSRFPNSFDWYWQDLWDGSSDGSSFSNGYTVPLGYVLILRHISITVYPKDGETISPMIDIYGFTIDTHNLILLVDNAATPNWTNQTQPNFTGAGGVPIYDLFSNDVNIPLFCLIDQGQTLDIEIPGVTTLTTGSQVRVIARYYGNLILATGRSLNAEVGNPDPLPVTAMG